MQTKKGQLRLSGPFFYRDSSASIPVCEKKVFSVMMSDLVLATSKIVFMAVFQTVCTERWEIGES